MKKILLAAVFLFVTKLAVAQDTIYWDDFNNELYHTYIQDYPPGTPYDTLAYSVDGDGLADGSGGTTERPVAWFLTYAFATEDSLTMDGDTNFVFAANSWFDSPDKALNFLITPSIYLLDNTATLSWKAAPYQTPYYCDGYKVLVSTTTNFEDQFTDTLFVAGEYDSTKDPMPDSTWNGYNFTEGFIHGQDGTYAVYLGDSARWRGLLRPFSVSLAQYANQKIFIAFLHDAFDDNLISVDDILITGNGTVDVAENIAKVEVTLFPNPANSIVNLNFNVVKPGQASIEVYDLAGKLIETRQLGGRLKGAHNYQFDVSKYVAGSYLLTLRTADGSKTLNMVIAK